MTPEKYIEPDLTRDDGTLWEASYESEGAAMAALFDRSAPQFFFREVVQNPKKSWWKFWKPSFVRTGRVWSGSGPLKDYGFNVIGD